MTDAELDTELCAIVAEELQLLTASRRLRRTPADVVGLAAHRERLQAHTARIRALSDAIDGPSAPQRLPTACPVCQSPSIVRRPYAETYRCVECRSEWMMTLPDAQATSTDVPSASAPFQTDRHGSLSTAPVRLTRRPC
jgi:ribosomal protein L37AE/L43A